MLLIDENNSRTNHRIEMIFFLEVDVFGRKDKHFPIQPHGKKIKEDFFGGITQNSQFRVVMKKEYLTFFGKYRN